jgi:hypothetical protein
MNAGTTDRVEFMGQPVQRITRAVPLGVDLRFLWSAHR